MLTAVRPRNEGAIVDEGHEFLGQRFVTFSCLGTATAIAKSIRGPSQEIFSTVPILFGKTHNQDRYLNIMFKVGEYYEYDAKTVASFLKDAGFKVDVKGWVTARIDHTASRQGKLSEIKENVDNFERYERFLDAVKAAVEKATSEDSFTDLMLTEFDPNWKSCEG